MRNRLRGARISEQARPCPRLRGHFGSRGELVSTSEGLRQSGVEPPHSKRHQQLARTEIPLRPKRRASAVSSEQAPQSFRSTSSPDSRMQKDRKHPPRQNRARRATQRVDSVSTDHDFSESLRLHVAYFVSEHRTPCPPLPLRFGQRANLPVGNQVHRHLVFEEKCAYSNTKFASNFARCSFYRLTNSHWNDVPL
jgi:hypothetical protein